MKFLRVGKLVLERDDFKTFGFHECFFRFVVFDGFVGLEFGVFSVNLDDLVSNFLVFGDDLSKGML